MLRSDTVERDAEGELTIPEAGDTTRADVDGRAGDIPPWLLTVAWLLLLLVVAALIVVLARRRRDDEDEDDEPPAAVAAPSPRAEAGVGPRQPIGV